MENRRGFVLDIENHLCVEGASLTFHAQHRLAAGPVEQQLVGSDPPANQRAQAGDKAFEKVDGDNHTSDHQTGVAAHTIGQVLRRDRQDVVILLLAPNDGFVVAQLRVTSGPIADDQQRQHDDDIQASLLQGYRGPIGEQFSRPLRYR